MQSELISYLRRCARDAARVKRDVEFKRTPDVARPKVQNHESHGMKQGSNYTSKKNISITKKFNNYKKTVCKIDVQSLKL